MRATPQLLHAATIRRQTCLKLLKLLYRHLYTHRCHLVSYDDYGDRKLHQTLSIAKSVVLGTINEVLDHPIGKLIARIQAAHIASKIRIRPPNQFVSGGFFFRPKRPILLGQEPLWKPHVNSKIRDLDDAFILKLYDQLIFMPLTDMR